MEIDKACQWNTDLGAMPKGRWLRGSVRVKATEGYPAGEPYEVEIFEPAKGGSGLEVGYCYHRQIGQHGWPSRIAGGGLELIGWRETP